MTKYFDTCDIENHGILANGTPCKLVDADAIRHKPQIDNKPPKDKQDCPGQMPVSYFGAMYPDSQCIDGYLWDEDSGDGDGLDSGGYIPCPFCMPEEHLSYMKHDFENVVCSVCLGPLTEMLWAATNKPSVKLYGSCQKCNCKQWADSEVIDDEE